MRPVAAASLAVASGLLYLAAFPPLEWTPLAWVALVPLLLAVRDRPLGQAMLLGWVSGTIACNGLTAPSIFEAASRYLESAWLLPALLALVIPQLFGALWFALFAGLVRGWSAAPLPVVFVPAAYVASELGRAEVGYGCPWVLLGHSQWAWSDVIQIADLGGVFAVSFVVALVNGAVALALWRRRAGGRALAPLGVAAMVVGAAVAYGAGIGSASASGEELRIALVQPDLAVDDRRSLAGLPAARRRLAALTEASRAERPLLIVWPENALGFAVPGTPALLGEAAAVLQPGQMLLLGAPRAVEEQPGQVAFRNAAFLLDATGAVRGTYEKQRLTPFAETTPLGDLVPRPSRHDDAYVAGDGGALFAVAGQPFAVLICWEAIYPDLARAAVRAGARFLVNISNDDWFGDRAALTQHLRATQFRAVEMRRPLVRVTNTGLSAVVDRRGAVVALLAPDQPGVAVVPVAPADGLSVYARVGDLFAWVCLALALGLWLATPAAHSMPNFSRR